MSNNHNNNNLFDDVSDDDDSDDDEYVLVKNDVNATTSVTSDNNSSCPIPDQYQALSKMGDQTGYIDVVLHHLYFFEPFRRLVIDRRRGQLEQEQQQAVTTTPEGRLWDVLGDLFLAMEQYLTIKIDSPSLSLEETTKIESGIASTASEFVDACEDALKLEYPIRDQNDASEFARKIFSVLERAEPKSSSSSSSLSSMQQLLGYTGGMKVSCHTCHHEKTNSQQYFMLDVGVRGTSSLEESLEKQFASEVMGGPNAMMCRNPTTCNKTKTDHTLRSQIFQLPDMLPISLKKFQLDYNTFETIKLNTRFSFPQWLNLSPYMGSNDEVAKYQLKGIINHAGFASHGYFYSLVRIDDKEKGLTVEEPHRRWVKIMPNMDVKWFEDFDEQVEEECYGGKPKHVATNSNGATTKSVMRERSCNAFMLFYERATD